MHEWLHRLDAYFPVRYTAWLLSGAGALLFGFTYVAFGVGGGWALLCLSNWSLSVERAFEARKQTGSAVLPAPWSS